MNETYNPLAQHFTLASLLRFALPSIVMMIFMGLYTIADTIFVSRCINTNALSALNIVCPIINLIIGIATMLATGGSAYIARKMGEGAIQEAKQSFTFLFLCTLAIGGTISILGLLFLDPIIKLLGASKILFPYCRQYMFVLLLFTPASMLQVLFQSLIVTAGHPSFGMILSIGAGIANVFFDYVLIVRLNMGISGSALGTGLGYMIPAGIGICFFFRSKGTLHFVRPKIQFRVLIHSCLNGFSEMVSQIAAAVTTFLFNLIMMDLLQEDGVAAIAILIYSQFMLTALYIGFSMGVAPIFSYHFGKKNSAQLQVLLKLSIQIILTISVILFVLAMTQGSALVQIFVTKDSHVYQLAVEGFYLFSFGFLFSGFNIFTSALFTALSNGVVSAILSSLRTFGFLILCLLTLPIFLQETGVWLAVPIAESFTTLFAIAFLVRNNQHYHYFM